MSRYACVADQKAAGFPVTKACEIADHMRTELVADALTMAVGTLCGHVAGVVFRRRPRVGPRVLAVEATPACERERRCSSMGATGVCCDNSVAESWFGTMERELARRRRWAARADAPRDLIRWIEGWFNSRRLHWSNNHRSPIDWENLYYRRGDGIAA